MDNHGLVDDHGHLPSSKLEREIMDSLEGIEDEDGNKSGMIRQDREDMPVFRQQKFNTGAKGCMQDARTSHAMFALQQEADKVRAKHRAQELALKGLMRQPVVAELDESEDDEFEDEEFQRYKLERLKQMQKQASEAVAMPTFGCLEEMDALDYPAAVDNAGSRTFVVVHLKEDHLACCAEMHQKLATLAARYDQVRFIEICASDASESIDAASLPILLAYQSGEFVSQENGVGRDKGAALEAADVEHVLLRMGVRLSASAVMRQADQAALQRLREMGFEESRGPKDDDEEDDEEEEETNWHKR